MAAAAAPQQRQRGGHPGDTDAAPGEEVRVGGAILSARAPSDGERRRHVRWCHLIRVFGSLACRPQTRLQVLGVGARAGGLWGPRSAPRRRTCGRPVGDPRGARPCPNCRYNPGWRAAGAGCCDLLPPSTGKRVRQKAQSAHAWGTAAAAASAAVTAPLGSRVAASASVDSRSAAAAVACATTGFCMGTDARGAAEQRRGCTRHGRRGVSPPRRRGRCPRHAPAALPAGAPPAATAV